MKSTSKSSLCVFVLGSSGCELVAGIGERSAGEGGEARPWGDMAEAAAAAAPAGSARVAERAARRAPSAR